MLITKTVSTVWNNASKKYYEDKGYIWEGRNKSFDVDVKDLPSGSHVLVEVACDYCNKKFNIQYRNYIKSLNSSEYVHKYCCENCDDMKKKEILSIKQSKGILKRSDRGYWTFKENRTNEFKNYININGSIDKMQYLDSVLYASIVSYDKKQPSHLAMELGFNIIDVVKQQKPDDYYNDIEVLISDIKGIVSDLGRFPKQQEILKILKISNNRLLKHGGIEEIRKIMGYENEILIDDLGFKNRSAYEYIVAQYLIHYTDIPYNREQNPFKEIDNKAKNYRSDFNFVTQEGEEIHVEMWGAPKKDCSSKRAIEYNKKRKKKEMLYKKYGIKLVSLDCENFTLKHNKDIHDYLDGKFKEYNGRCEFKDFDINIYLPSDSMSDEEILEEILKYSNKKGLLPKTEEIFKQNRHCLYYECIKRYGSYDNFAKHFNYKTHYRAWNKEDIIDVFNYMINKYGYILRNFEMREMAHDDAMFKGFNDGVKKFFKSYIDATICYCEYCISNNFINNLCNYKTITYLKQIADILPSSMNNRHRTSLAKDKAKNIVDIINNNKEEFIYGKGNEN